MKQLLLLPIIAGSFFLLANDSVSQKKEGDLVGTWTNEFDQSVMDFKKEGNVYVGILTKPAKGHELDKNGNPRGHEKIIKGLKYKNGKYVDGEIYITKLDKYMDCDISINGDTFNLTVRFGLMKRTVEWQRIK